MSARDDLVAAMEALRKAVEARKAYEHGGVDEAHNDTLYDDYAEASDSFMDDGHADRILALLDAEPVAWAYFEDATGKIDGDPDTSLDALTEYGQREVLPGFTVRPLYARPEASDER